MQDRKKSEKWLRLADEQNSMLSETERENVKKYLDHFPNAPVVTSVPTVPEHIDIGSNNSGEIDSLSLGMTYTTVGMTYTTGVSSVADTNATTLSSHSNNGTVPSPDEHSIDLRYRNHENIQI